MTTESLTKCEILAIRIAAILCLLITLVKVLTIEISSLWH
jgi:hypothetical protein